MKKIECLAEAIHWMARWILVFFKENYKIIIVIQVWIKITKNPYIRNKFSYTKMVRVIWGTFCSVFVLTLVSIMHWKRKKKSFKGIHYNAILQRDL